MVRIRVKDEYFVDYPEKCMETAIINKEIAHDFRKFCKKHNINKSKLIEKFYKEILIKIGNLNIARGYITINIFDKAIQKKKLKEFHFGQSTPDLQEPN